jgi:hypothetical protein
MRQAVLVGKRLAEVDGSAGLVDVRRIWEREREKPAESGGEEDGEWMRPES